MKAITHGSAGLFFSTKGILSREQFLIQRRRTKELCLKIFGVVILTVLAVWMIYTINFAWYLPEVHVSASTGKVVEVLDGKTRKPVTDPVVRAKLLEGCWSGGGPVYVP